MSRHKSGIAQDPFYIPGQLDEESRFYFSQSLELFENQSDEKGIVNNTHKQTNNT